MLMNRPGFVHEQKPCMMTIHLHSNQYTRHFPLRKQEHFGLEDYYLSQEKFPVVLTIRKGNDLKDLLQKHMHHQLGE